MFGSPIRTCADPLIEPSGLRISWASWAAISPTAASFSLTLTSSSRRFTSVRFWKTSRYPAPAGSVVSSFETETPTSTSSPEG